MVGWHRQDESLCVIFVHLVYLHEVRYNVPEDFIFSVRDTAAALSVQTRRIYDVINVLDALHIVSRANLKQGTYRWLGTRHVGEALATLKAQADKMKAAHIEVHPASYYMHHHM